jgi:hypothetical protein
MMTPQQQQRPPMLQSPSYVTAAQAGLSPSPFSPVSYSTAYDHYPQQAQQQQQQPPSSSAAMQQYELPPQQPLLLTPDLSPDEASWLQYVRNHELLPYIDSRSASDREKGNEKFSASMSNITVPQTPGSSQAAPPPTNYGFALVLNKITGIRIPPQVEAKESRQNLRFRVQLSFFDTLHKRFFGRTWVSPLHAIGAGSSIGQQILYYRSSLYSEYCVGVVEYVLCTIRQEPGMSGQGFEEVIVDKYAIGWTVLTLFSRDVGTLTDINDPAVDLEESVGDMSMSMMDVTASTAMVAASTASKLKRRQLSKKLWAGTPRALLFMEPINFSAPLGAAASDWTKKLTQAVGFVGADGLNSQGQPQTQQAVTLLYELFLCRALSPFFHLFREFEVLGARDVVAGLPLVQITNPTGTQKKFGRTRGACLPSDPRLLRSIFLPSFSLKLRNPTVNLPGRWESSMMEQVTSIKMMQWASGSEMDAVGASGSSQPLEKAIIGRSLVIGIHNGRKYIRTPYKLALVLASTPAAGLTPRGDPEDGPMQLTFPGETNIISDLACSVADDPQIALTFELQYEIRWNKSQTPHNPMVQTIVVAWTTRLLSQLSLSNGSPTTFSLQRGPGRTLTNARVYGFADEREEARRREKGEIVAITVALESTTFGAQPSQAQQQYLTVPQQQQQQNIPSAILVGGGAMNPQQPPRTPGQDAHRLPQFNRAVTTPVQGPPSQQQAQFGGAPRSPTGQFPPAPFGASGPQPNFMQQQGQQGFGSPNNRMRNSIQQQQQPFGGPSAMNTMTQFNPNQQQQFGSSPMNTQQFNHNSSQFGTQQSGNTFNQSQLNLQPAYGLSVGIQTGPELQTYDQLAASQGNPMSQSLSASQGYSRVRSSPSGASMRSPSSGGAQPIVMGKPISLAKEMVDPLKGAQIELHLTHFSQSLDDHAVTPVNSLVFLCRLFDSRAWKSQRIPLQVVRDATYDPRAPQAHQLYNQADKLHPGSAQTVSTNPFHATLRLTVAPQLHRLFVEYLYTRALDIEVYDGDTLFLVGIARLPLFQALRQGQPEVSKQFDLPVVESALRGSLWEKDAAPESGLMVPDGASPVGSVGATRGTLGVSFTHIGLEPTDQQEAELLHQAASTIPSVASSQLATFSTGGQANAITALRSKRPGPRDPSVDAFVGLPSNVSLNTTINRPSRRRVKPLAEADHTDPAFLATLSGRQGLMGKLDAGGKTQLIQETFSSPNRRASLTRTGRPKPSPIHRADILSASMSRSQATGLAAGADEFTVRASNLRKIKQQRERQRGDQISSMLRSAHSAVRTIYPSYGALVFFELAFTNPHPRRTRFRVRIDDPCLDPLRFQQDVDGRPMEPECTIVQESREWLYLKSLYGLNTPTSLTMFSEANEPIARGGGGIIGSGDSRKQDLMSPRTKQSRAAEEKEQSSTSYSDREAIYIVLEGGETSYIPVKFQSFNAGDVSGNPETDAFPSVRGATVNGVQSRPIAHRILQVNVETLDEEASTVAYLRVDVRPHCFHVDRTLRFQHWSDEILRSSINLNTMQPSTNPIRQQLIQPSPSAALDSLSAGHPLLSSSQRHSDAFQSNLHIMSSSRVQRVACSSNEVAIDFKEPQQQMQEDGRDNNGNEVSFKIRVGSYPSVSRFYLCLYSDVYSANLQSIVEVVVSSHLRAELTAITGQRTTGRIFLPSTDRPRRVHMCSSSSELTFAGPAEGAPSQTSAQFVLQPGQVNTLDYTYRTSQSGKRSCLLNLIDLDSFDLVQSWALFVQASYPKVSNTFSVSLKVGQGARKTFDYANEFNTQRTYFFESSAPERMKLREEMVTIPPLAVVS